MRAWTILGATTLIAWVGLMNIQLVNSTALQVTISGSSWYDDLVVPLRVASVLMLSISAVAFYKGIRRDK